MKPENTEHTQTDALRKEMYYGNCRTISTANRFVPSL
jgi:hypothetical protein